MILALDVDYTRDNSATAAGVSFAAFTDDRPLQSLVQHVNGIAPYVPGEFYKRELPCVLPLIEQIGQAAIETVIVDGYVEVAEGKPGLGRHLHDALNRSCRVIGVAKSEFVGAPAERLLRGGSKTPLWITATDDASAAAALIASMHGPHRMPILLRLVDRLARGLETP